MTVAGDVVAQTADDEPQKIKKRTSIHAGEGRLAFILVAPTVALLGVVVGYPIVKAIYQSFLSDQGLDAARSSTRAASGSACSTTSTGCSSSARMAGGGTVHCPTGNLGASSTRRSA